MKNVTHTRRIAIGVAFLSSVCTASSQTPALVDLPGWCKPSETQGCTRSWSAKEKSCVTDCKAIAFPGLPITVAGPIPTTSTGPATGGTNRMEPRQLREIIRSGSLQQRAQVADWLATPTINLALDPAARPMAPELLSPDMRDILKAIRQGTEKERSMAAERLFKESK
jgi:hypothetical protein